MKITIFRLVIASRSVQTDSMQKNAALLGEKKKQLRQEIRRRLALLSQEEQDRESDLLVKKLADFLTKAGHQKATIATFAAFGKEVNLAALQQRIPLASFCYPRCEKEGIMHFHHIVSSEKELHRGYIGLSEPSEKAPLVPPGEIDLILVPGLAFDRKGNRLGKGGGFYDRYLSQDEIRADLWGVCFICQITEDIPCSPLDKKVDQVLTAE